MGQSYSLGSVRPGGSLGRRVETNETKDRGRVNLAVQDGAYLSGERSARHQERRRRRRFTWWLVAGGAWGLLLCLVLAAIDQPSTVAWPTGHQLRTAQLELDARWAAAVAEAGADGLGLARLESNHVAALLNRLVGADPADPEIGVSLRQGVAEVRCRLRGPLGVRPVLTLTVRPSLLGDSLFCAVDGVRLGRCPLPLALWHMAMRHLASPVEAHGWSTREGVIGYVWPARGAAGSGSIEIQGLTCSEGLLEVTLCEVRQPVDAGR